MPAALDYASRPDEEGVVAVGRQNIVITAAAEPARLSRHAAAAPFRHRKRIYRYKGDFPNTFQLGSLHFLAVSYQRLIPSCRHFKA